MSATSRWLAVAVLASAVACSSSSRDGAPSGYIKVQVQAVTSGWDVTRINIDVQPAGISQDLAYDQSTYAFTGVVVGVPLGTQTLTARAFLADGTQVGVGTTTVAVTAGATASVYLKIYDTTGPEPVPDHGPIITTLAADRVEVQVGEVVHLSGTAVDPDGDTLTFAWTQTCNGTFSAPDQLATLPFRGVEGDREGAAGWNADGTGPEMFKTGHDLSWVTCAANSVAFYYLASRDFAGIDPGSSGGVHAIPGSTGFPSFEAALDANGFTLSDVTLSWGLQTLGADEEGSDWSVAIPIETRRYAGGTFAINLRGEEMIGGAMPHTTVSIDYGDLAACFDDRISGQTEPVRPVDMSAASSAAVRAVAAAFLTDLGGEGIRFAFDSFQPALQQLEFVGNGRAGAFFDVQGGRIEMTPLPGPDDAPQTSTTAWTAGEPGSCMLTFTATSGTPPLHDAVGVHVLVGQPTGTVSVGGEFVPHPRISRVAVDKQVMTAQASLCDLHRDGPNASCSGTFGASQTVFVHALADYRGPDAVWTLSDDCGGSSTLGVSAGWQEFRWTAPAAGGLCTITPAITIGPVADAFPIALAVAACPDDNYEPNDSFDHATVDYGLFGTSLFANDDDWFYVQTGSDLLTLSVTSVDDLTIEIFTDGGVYLGSGVNTVTVPAVPHEPYLAHVLPGTNAATCAAAYELTWQ